MTVPFLQDSTFTGLISTQYHGTSQQWNEAYNTVSLFIQTSAINIQSTTFDELTGFKFNKTLIPGQLYIINDFELKWRNQGFYDQIILNSGTVEPLIVRALSTDKLEPEAYSVLHPNDIVYYNINAKTSETWGDFPGPGADISGFKGWISRRVDLVRNIDIGWDWRYITSNCCKFDFTTIPVYSTVTTYNIKALVRSTAGKLFYSIRNSNLNNSLTNTNWWLPVSDAVSEIDTYYPTNEVSFGLLPAIANFGFTVTPILSTRTQFPTFVDPNNSSITNVKIESGFNNIFLSTQNPIKNCTIGENFSYNLIYGFLGTAGSFENNKIDGGFQSNVIGYSFINNTINTNFKNNITTSRFGSLSPVGVEFCDIDHNCINNVFNRTFQNNNLGNGVSNNIFGVTITNNDIKNNCSNNFIGGFFSNNNANNSFQFNTIESTFSFNSINDFCTNNNFKTNVFYNDIDNNFQYNNIDSNFQYNNISNDFQYNTIQNFYTYNTVGNSFINNTIGNDFNNNTIGNTCTDNVIQNNVQFNSFGNEFKNNILGSNFQFTSIEKGIENIDFSTATHVYNTYNKTIFLNASNLARLSYFNNTDQLVVTDPES